MQLNNSFNLFGLDRNPDCINDDAKGHPDWEEKEREQGTDKWKLGMIDS